MTTAPSPRVTGRLAGLLLIGGGGLTLAYLFVPGPPLMSRFAVTLVSLVAMAIGVFCLVAPWERWHTSVALLLVPLAFGLIALGNFYGAAQPWTFGIFFVVVFTWLGIGFPRGYSALFAPLATVGYVLPIVFRSDSDLLGATSAIITIPVSVLVGESIAWIGDRLRLSQERSEALARTAAVLSAHLDEDELLQALATEARRSLGAEHALLTQLDPASLTIRKIYTAGVAGSIRSYVRSMQGTSYADYPALAHLTATRRPVVAEHASDSDLVPRQMIERLGVRSFMMIPILSHGELVGVLSCGESSRRRRYSDEDVALAEALAAQAGAAIRNAALYRQTLEASRCDPLTGLGNRRAFHERLADEVERARRYRRSLSLVLLDADHFKAINDRWGHLTGDRVLGRLAALLLRSLRQGDGAFRIGGDEFALLLPETGPRGSAVLAERVRRSVSRAGLGSGDGPRMSVSVGVATYPHHGETPDEMFSRADTCLYEAKAAGGDAVSVVPAHPGDGSAVLLGVNVREVIEQRRLAPLYQPIVDLRTGRVAAYEAFCQIDPELGPVPTSTAFRAAAALGLSEALDRTCRDVVLGGVAGLPADALLFVNVSPIVLEVAEFDPCDILGPAGEAGLSPERLVVEVTEMDRSPRSEFLSASLDRCRDAGLKIALDDLGTGSADLDVLGQVPFDYVKIDTSFVRGADADAGRRRLLQGLRLLVGETGAEAVAEGVEDVDDLRMVAELGFEAAQGYVLGAPRADFAVPDLPDLGAREA